MIKTISDIARMAGVAKSTVSRYLNGGPVSEKTRRKIEHIIKEQNYVPNTFAQSLKAKKTKFYRHRGSAPRFLRYFANLDRDR
ncbi:hypothetical protein HMSSN036_08820 [Paenibacillus macerans]|nr:hypothetical protein HMSSN036_08820 [Paenibacillus macerans]